MTGHNPDDRLHPEPPDVPSVDTLVRTTSLVVWRVCAALVDAATADDLTQETFLRAVRSLPTLHDPERATAWVLTIARRVCAEEISRRQRSRALLAALDSRAAPHHPDAFELVAITDALDRLAPQRREAFLLTAVAGLSYDDAAAMCGCPVGTIRSRVSRARADLAQALTASTTTDDRTG